MNNMRNNEKYILLDNLFNLYLDSKVQDEDVDFLKTEKVDVNQIVNKNLMLFKQLRVQAKAELNDSKHRRVFDFISEFRNGLESNLIEYRQMADEIFSQPKFAELQPMFRNLSKVSETDKNSILLDSKLLDLLDEIEEEYNIKDKDE